MSDPEPLTPGTLLAVIDMQRLFAEKTAWHTPTLGDIVPAVVRLASAQPERTMFARFAVPPNAEAAAGRWRTYYRRWSSMTGERLPVAFTELVAPLAAIARDDATFDKCTYSIFGAPAFEARLVRDGVDTVILAGVETDVCVLASVFDAVDRGYRVIVAADAVTSSSAAGHAAVLDAILPRMGEQVDIMKAETILALWR